ncbi:hypothetical protein FHU30_005389 [Actinomadura rupiterrae]|nr:hypothetical protein [Actinomadura rupiterrae]
MRTPHPACAAHGRAQHTGVRSTRACAAHGRAQHTGVRSTWTCAAHGRAQHRTLPTPDTRTWHVPPGLCRAPARAAQAPPPKGVTQRPVRTLGYVPPGMRRARARIAGASTQAVAQPSTRDWRVHTRPCAIRRERTNVDTTACCPHARTRAAQARPPKGVAQPGTRTWHVPPGIRRARARSAGASPQAVAQPGTRVWRVRAGPCAPEGIAHQRGHHGLLPSHGLPHAWPPRRVRVCVLGAAGVRCAGRVVGAACGSSGRVRVRPRRQSVPGAASGAGCVVSTCGRATTAGPLRCTAWDISRAALCHG